MRTLRVVAGGMLSLFLGFIFSCAPSAKAVVFVVSETNDTLDVTSLRGAVIAANRIGATNTIILPQALKEDREKPHQRVYWLTISGADEDAGTTGDLDITNGEVTIVGAGAGVTIDASGLGDRVFRVLPGSSLTLENLTITGGNAAGTNYGNSADGEPGGAIYNEGTLGLKDCVIIGNSSGNGICTSVVGGNGGDGGGIYNSGVLTMDGCVVTENVCGAGTNDELGVGHNGGNGGGIYNSGKMLLHMCIICNNVGGEGAAAGSPPNGVAIGASGGPGGSGGDGGGIYNARESELNFCTLTDNSGGNGGYGYDGGSGGSGGNGGGIFNSGEMAIGTCVVTNNFSGQGTDGSSPFGYNIIHQPGGAGGAGGNGGGIFNVGQVNLSFSTVSENGSGSGGNGNWGLGGGNGGTGGDGSGIFNSDMLNLNTCTVSENICGNGGNGGGGWFYGGGGNGGDGGNGGGIYDTGMVGSVSCTVALNSAGAGGSGYGGSATGGAGGCGGGILNAGSGTNVIARNTLIALNAAFDLAGNFTSQGYNLVGVGDYSTGFVNGVNADKVGTAVSPIDPLIGPLRMNGGFTPTHALLWGSPAIDQGNCSGIHRDQRGRYRPHIYPWITEPLGGDGTDIGAFELDSREREPTVLIPHLPNCSTRGSASSNQFGFSVAGPSNSVVVVEVCTNLANPVWCPAQTNTLAGGSCYFNDSQWTNYPGRFYRVRAQ